MGRKRITDDPRGDGFFDLAGIPHIDRTTGRSYRSKLDLMLSESGRTVACRRHAPQGDSAKRSNFLVFACAHCTRQDLIHPVGMVAMKGRLYLCKRCYDRLDMKRGFKPNEEIRTACWGCVMEEAARLKSLDPVLLVDMTQPQT